MNCDDERRHMLRLAASLEEIELFNYSKEQWQAIEALVERDLEPAKRGGRRGSSVLPPIMGRVISAPRPGRSTPTEPFNYAALRTAANCFRADEFEPPHERRPALEELLERTEQFRFSLLALKNSADLLSEELFALLDKVYSRARYQLTTLNIEGSPRWHFYNAVLDCWVNAGGQLKMSRCSPGSDRAGQPTGPLIEYFEAAVRPLMEDRTPGREAIYKIVAQRKATDAVIDAEIEKAINGDARDPATEALRDGRKRGEW